MAQYVRYHPSFPSAFLCLSLVFWIAFVQFLSSCSSVLLRSSRASSLISSVGQTILTHTAYLELSLYPDSYMANKYHSLVISIAPGVSTVDWLYVRFFYRDSDSLVHANTTRLDMQITPIVVDKGFIFCMSLR